MYKQLKLHFLTSKSNTVLGEFVTVNDVEQRLDKYMKSHLLLVVWFWISWCSYLYGSKPGRLCSLIKTGHKWSYFSDFAPIGGSKNCTFDTHSVLEKRKWR